jgi:hypothetical protein
MLSIVTVLLSKQIQCGENGKYLKPAIKHWVDALKLKGENVNTTKLAKTVQNPMPNCYPVIAMNVRKFISTTNIFAKYLNIL